MSSIVDETAHVDASEVVYVGNQLNLMNLIEDDFPLKFHVPSGGIVCTACRTSMFVTSGTSILDGMTYKAWRHYTRSHQENIVNNDTGTIIKESWTKKQLDICINKYTTQLGLENISELIDRGAEFVPQDSLPVLPVEGLFLYTGTQSCSQCDYFCPKVSSLRQHFISNKNHQVRNHNFEDPLYFQIFNGCNGVRVTLSQDKLFENNPGGVDNIHRSFPPINLDSTDCHVQHDVNNITEAVRHMRVDHVKKAMIGSFLEKNFDVGLNPTGTGNPADIPKNGFVPQNVRASDVTALDQFCRFEDNYPRRLAQMYGKAIFPLLTKKSGSNNKNKNCSSVPTVIPTNFYPNIRELHRDLFEQCQISTSDLPMELKILLDKDRVDKGSSTHFKCIQEATTGERYALIWTQLTVFALAYFVTNIKKDVYNRIVQDIGVNPSLLQVEQKFNVMDDDQKPNSVMIGLPSPLLDSSTISDGNLFLEKTNIPKDMHAFYNCNSNYRDLCNFTGIFDVDIDDLEIGCFAKDGQVGARKHKNKQYSCFEISERLTGAIVKLCHLQSALDEENLQRSTQIIQDSVTFAEEMHANDNCYGGGVDVHDAQKSDIVYQQREVCVKLLRIWHMNFATRHCCPKGDIIEQFLAYSTTNTHHGSCIRADLITSNFASILYCWKILYGDQAHRLTDNHLAFFLSKQVYGIDEYKKNSNTNNNEKHDCFEKGVINKESSKDISFESVGGTNSSYNSSFKKQNNQHCHFEPHNSDLTKNRDDNHSTGKCSDDDESSSCSSDSVISRSEQSEAYVYTFRRCCHLLIHYVSTVLDFSTESIDMDTINTTDLTGRSGQSRRSSSTPNRHNKVTLYGNSVNTDTNGMNIRRRGCSQNQKRGKGKVIGQHRGRDRDRNAVMKCEPATPFVSVSHMIWFVTGTSSKDLAPKISVLGDAITLCSTGCTLKLDQMGPIVQRCCDQMAVISTWIIRRLLLPGTTPSLSDVLTDGCRGPAAVSLMGGGRGLFNGAGSGSETVAAALSNGFRSCGNAAKVSSDIVVNQIFRNIDKNQRSNTQAAELLNMNNLLKSDYLKAQVLVKDILDSFPSVCLLDDTRCSSEKPGASLIQHNKCLTSLQQRLLYFTEFVMTHVTQNAVPDILRAFDLYGEFQLFATVISGVFSPRMAQLASCTYVTTTKKERNVFHAHGNVIISATYSKSRARQGNDGSAYGVLTTFQTVQENIVMTMTILRPLEIIIRTAFLASVVDTFSSVLPKSVIETLPKEAFAIDQKGANEESHIAMMDIDDNFNDSYIAATGNNDVSEKKNDKVHNFGSDHLVSISTIGNTAVSQHIMAIPIQRSQYLHKQDQSKRNNNTEQERREICNDCSTYVFTRYGRCATGEQLNHIFRRLSKNEFKLGAFGIQDWRHVAQYLSRLDMFRSQASLYDEHMDCVNASLSHNGNFAGVAYGQVDGSVFSSPNEDPHWFARSIQLSLYAQHALNLPVLHLIEKMDVMKKIDPLSKTKAMIRERNDENFRLQNSQNGGNNFTQHIDNNKKAHVSTMMVKNGNQKQIDRYSNSLFRLSIPVLSRPSYEGENITILDKSLISMESPIITSKLSVHQKVGNEVTPLTHDFVRGAYHPMSTSSFGQTTFGRFYEGASPPSNRQLESMQAILDERYRAQFGHYAARSSTAAQAMGAVLSNSSNYIILLGTSSGKTTMMVNLPVVENEVMTSTMISSPKVLNPSVRFTNQSSPVPHVTVIFVTLIQALLEIETKCQKHQCEYRTWSLDNRSQHSNYNNKDQKELPIQTAANSPPIILIQLEWVQHNVGYLEIFLKELSRHGRLRRFMVEEAHILVTQERIREMGFLRHILCSCAVPVIAWSGSLSPSHEDDLLSQLGRHRNNTAIIRDHDISPRVRIAILRTNTNPCYFPYHAGVNNSMIDRIPKDVRLINDGATVSTASETYDCQGKNDKSNISIPRLIRFVTNHIISTCVGDLKERERIIVSCMDVTTATSIVTVLVNEFGKKTFMYNGRMNLQQRNTAHNQWSDPANGKSIMVCTSAYMAAVDYPFVRTVYAVNGAYNLEDIVQLLGRCTRSDDARIGRAYIVVDGGEQFRLNDDINDQQKRDSYDTCSNMTQSNPNLVSVQECNKNVSTNNNISKVGKFNVGDEVEFSTSGSNKQVEFEQTTFRPNICQTGGVFMDSRHNGYTIKPKQFLRPIIRRFVYEPIDQQCCRRLHLSRVTGSPVTCVIYPPNSQVVYCDVCEQSRTPQNIGRITKSILDITQANILPTNKLICDAMEVKPQYPIVTTPEQSSSFSKKRTLAQLEMPTTVSKYFATNKVSPLSLLEPSIDNNFHRPEKRNNNFTKTVPESATLFLHGPNDFRRASEGVNFDNNSKTQDDINISNVSINNNNNETNQENAILESSSNNELDNSVDPIDSQQYDKCNATEHYNSVPYFYLPTNSMSNEKNSKCQVNTHDINLSEDHTFETTTVNRAINYQHGNQIPVLGTRSLSGTKPIIDTIVSVASPTPMVPKGASSYQIVGSSQELLNGAIRVVPGITYEVTTKSSPTQGVSQLCTTERKVPPSHQKSEMLPPTSTKSPKDELPLPDESLLIVNNSSIDIASMRSKLSTLDFMTEHEIEYLIQKISPPGKYTPPITAHTLVTTNSPGQISKTDGVRVPNFVSSRIPESPILKQLPSTTVSTMKNRVTGISVPVSKILKSGESTQSPSFAVASSAIVPSHVSVPRSLPLTGIGQIFYPTPMRQSVWKYMPVCGAGFAAVTLANLDGVFDPNSVALNNNIIVEIMPRFKEILELLRTSMQISQNSEVCLFCFIDNISPFEHDSLNCRRKRMYCLTCVCMDCNSRTRPACRSNRRAFLGHSGSPGLCYQCMSWYCANGWLMCKVPRHVPDIMWGICTVFVRLAGDLYRNVRDNSHNSRNGTNGTKDTNNGQPYNPFTITPRIASQFLSTLGISRLVLEDPGHPFWTNSYLMGSWFVTPVSSSRNVYFPSGNADPEFAHCNKINFLHIILAQVMTLRKQHGRYAEESALQLAGIHRLD